MTPALIPTKDHLQRAIAACLAGLAGNTQRAYARWIATFQASGQPLTREGVSLWAQSLTGSGITVNQAISAVKRLATEAANLGWLEWETAIRIGAIRSRKYRGVRTGRWLTLPQVRAILAAPDRSTLAGRRDAAVLALLIGCGIRRQEACSLNVSQVQQGADGMILANLMGKGQRVRTLSVPAWAARDIAAWRQPGDGRLLRSISAEGVVNGSLSVSSIRDIVRRHAAKIGVSEIAPHDMRRSYAALARAGGCPIEVIQASLGHASIQTTDRYLSSVRTGDAGKFIQVEEK